MTLQELNDELKDGPKRTMRPLKIAIDFDGVIHDPFNVKKGYKMGQPIPGAAEAIRQLRLQGHEAIIFPTWADNQKRRQALVDWLTYFSVEFDDITSVKPEADVYLDNHAIRFTNWEQAISDIQRLGAQATPVFHPVGDK